MQAEIKTCLVEVKATYLEVNSEKIEFEAERDEVPKEAAAVETFGAPKERFGDRHSAVRRRGQPKKRTQGSGGYRKNLAVSCRRMTCRVIPTRRKGHCFQGQGKDKALRRTQKGHTFGKRSRAKPEGINGIRIKGLKELLRLGSKGNINKTFRETLGLENAKRIAGSSVRI
jgi:hypothetical protein